MKCAIYASVGFLPIDRDKREMFDELREIETTQLVIELRDGYPWKFAMEKIYNEIRPELEALQMKVIQLAKASQG